MPQVWDFKAKSAFVETIQTDSSQMLISFTRIGLGLAWLQALIIDAQSSFSVTGIRRQAGESSYGAP